MIKIRVQGDLLEYLNTVLAQEAERQKELERDDFDDDDDDSEWKDACSNCSRDTCNQCPYDVDDDEWPDFDDDDDNDDEEEFSVKVEDTKLSHIIQRFVNKCAAADRLPTLQEAQTIAILHSVIK